MTILGDAVRHAVPDLRLEAESVMVDQAIITRPGGEPVLNEVTGILEPAESTTIYEGCARVRMPAVNEANVLFGEQEVTTTRFVVCVPWSVTGPQIGDVVEFVEATDPTALDRTLRIVSTSTETHPIQRRYGCEAVE